MRAHLTDRYQTALEQLARHASVQPFAGAASFYAWERLNHLIARLEALYDRVELEGEVEPARCELAAFESDLARLGVRSDPGLERHLRALWAATDQPALQQELTGRAGLPEVSWPDSYLAVRPETLAALLRDRQGMPEAL